jgi:hypothetical protein
MLGTADESRLSGIVGTDSPPPRDGEVAPVQRQREREIKTRDRERLTLAASCSKAGLSDRDPMMTFLFEKKG